MSAAVSWGLLSTARINGALVAAARESELADVVAVASRDDARAREYAGLLDIPRAHGSYEALLADPAVDAVYVSLPNGLHVDWTVRALQAGKHVLCEKPMDPSPQAVTRAFDVAEREGLVLSEGYMWRHHPQARRLAELLADGVVGDVRLVRAWFSFTLADRRDPRLDPALDGGSLLDVGCYCVSGIRLAVGREPVSATAEVVAGATGVDLRLAGVLRFDGDVLAVLDCGFDLPARHGLEIVGSRGRLALADPWHGREPQISLEVDGTTSLVDTGSADPYLLELDDVSAAIRDRRDPLLGRADAVGQAHAIAALLRSAAERRAAAVTQPAP
ncbi:MAG TPA: Gfo/Idh/MocA family oxidoreductase [Solirubrobacteraceae bacterium]|nr:Gfo/Idh/MocA family oxidoreductase [Solirubrobacteraceae bacterium]